MWWPPLDLCSFRRSKVISFHAFDVCWMGVVIGHLVISPLWAEELSFGIYQRYQGHTLTTSKLSTQRVSISLVAMLSLLNDQLFGILYPFHSVQ